MWTESLVEIVHAQNELFSLLKVSEGLDLWKNQWVQLQYLVLVGPEVQCDRQFQDGVNEKQNGEKYGKYMSSPNEGNHKGSEAVSYPQGSAEKWYKLPGSYISQTCEN